MHTGKENYNADIYIYILLTTGSSRPISPYSRIVDLGWGCPRPIDPRCIADPNAAPNKAWWCAHPNHVPVAALSACCVHTRPHSGGRPCTLGTLGSSIGSNTDSATMLAAAVTACAAARGGGVRACVCTRVRADGSQDWSAGAGIRARARAHACVLACVRVVHARFHGAVFDAAGWRAADHVQHVPLAWNARSV